MRYLLFLALVGCAQEHHDPIFKAGQSVIFVPPTFYSLVCSGKGTVVDYGYYEYKIETPGSETKCSNNLVIKESLIKVNEL